MINFLHFALTIIRNPKILFLLIRKFEITLKFLFLWDVLSLTDIYLTSMELDGMLLWPRRRSKLLLLIKANVCLGSPYIWWTLYWIYGFGALTWADHPALLIASYQIFQFLFSILYCCFSWYHSFADWYILLNNWFILSFLYCWIIHLLGNWLNYFVFP
jgi:hypothetical protein